jgi:predicted ATP-dependent endonuclease of OLD family
MVNEMPLKSLKALNVMLFKRKNTGALLQEINEVGFLQQNNNFSDALKMQFSGGVNLIIGENGLGKTTILKMLYAACEWSNELTTPTNLETFFQATLKILIFSKALEMKRTIAHLKYETKIHNLYIVSHTLDSLVLIIGLSNKLKLYLFLQLKCFPIQRAFLQWIRNIKCHLMEHR